MRLLITRDERGNVTILDPATGKSEVVPTGIADRPAQTSISEDAKVPAHSWGQLPSHSWGRLA